MFKYKKIFQVVMLHFEIFKTKTNRLSKDKNDFDGFQLSYLNGL